MVFSADIKPLEQRRAELDAMVRAKLDSAAYDAFRDSTRMERLRCIIMAAMLGRELWERYWAVYRDGLELEADQLFEAQEKNKAKDREIFG